MKKLLTAAAMFITLCGLGQKSHTRIDTIPVVMLVTHWEGVGAISMKGYEAVRLIYRERHEIMFNEYNVSTGVRIVGGYDTVHQSYLYTTKNKLFDTEIVWAAKRIKP